MILDGAPSGAAVLEYVKPRLVPTLPPGDIVVMDTPPAHQLEAVRQAIEKVGVELCFLPPDSPDVNPIARAFSKLKAFLKKTAATPDALAIRLWTFFHPTSQSRLLPGAQLGRRACRRAVDQAPVR
ncbi:MAG: transposase [Rhodospirillaceae bacterium]|nr:MAG: transposase [Rhodospirillaceae bacterium]